MDKQEHTTKNYIPDIKRVPSTLRLYFPFDTELLYTSLHFKAGDYMVSGRFIEQYCPICNTSNVKPIIKEYRPTMDVDRAFHGDRMILVLPVGPLTPVSKFYSRLAEDVENSVIRKSAHYFFKRMMLAYIYIEGKFYIYTTRKNYDPELWPEWNRESKSGWIWHRKTEDASTFIWLEGEILFLHHPMIEERPHIRCRLRDCLEKKQLVRKVLEGRYGFCADFLVFDLGEFYKPNFDEEIIADVLKTRCWVKIIIVNKIYEYKLPIGDTLRYYERELLKEGYRFVPVETVKNEVIRWYIKRDIDYDDNDDEDNDYNGGCTDSEHNNDEYNEYDGQ